MTSHRRIDTRAELAELAYLLGVQPDWHEPDEQEVDIQIKGVSFDNCGTWGPDFDARHDDGSADRFREVSVILTQGGEPVAEVNLATLFAWATGYRGRR